MVAPPESQPSSPLDSRVIGGWAALEHGDIDEARAVLRDVYAVDPAHPALPLLAAGIRRARPKRLPWRGLFLLFGLLAVGAVTWRSYARDRVVEPQAPTSGTDVALPEKPASPPPVTFAVEGPIGTAGGVAPPSASALSSQTPAAANDDGQIRQAIFRFAAAYSSRWANVTFPSCEITRNDDTASAECLSSTAAASGDGQRGGRWLFVCRKMGDSWKIVSMQPPGQ